jgi:CheY-like chemotaxis protein
VRSATCEHQSPLVAIIEDDETITALLCELLEAEQYRCLTASSLVTALDLLDREQPDLLILDIVLGGVAAGWQLLDRLAESPRTAAIPVIVCSADTRTLEAHDGLIKARGIRILAKPFDLEELLQLIASGLAASANHACAQPRR